MKLDVSHKTIFVLDRGPLFSKSSRQSIEHDVLMKAKVPGIIPAAPIFKSMWTCSVEATLEYIRVVYDIFPVLTEGNKLIQVITSDIQAQNVNSWRLKDQNMQQMHVGLAGVGAPDSDYEDDGDSNVMHGLTRAIEALCVPTDIQHSRRTSLDENEVVENHGRIICLTSVKSEGHIRTLEECVYNSIVQHNLLASSTDTLMPLKTCELILLHITPVGETTTINKRPKREVSPLLSSEVVVTQSGCYLYYIVMTMVQEHYSLSSTTVTGIPMKEEQNASSSANYDVELLHPADAHSELNLTAQGDGLVVQSYEIPTTKTITLKWCTPKTNNIELNYNTTAQRITPVDVNSRPSLCLTNFLLSGRSVLLEQPSKPGVKVISHMLTSHGSEIFIHALSTVRSCLEDPPSISEGCGGRVTDYRITDFGKLMRENRLVPCIPPSASEEMPINRAIARLERVTRKWPMTINDTIIYKMSSLQPLISLITKDSLTEEEVRTCTMSIIDTLGMENRNDPLPIAQLAGARVKGPKREEQYRLMWADLESLLEVHHDTSPSHQSVLDFLLQCKKSANNKAPLDVDQKPGAETVKEELGVSGFVAAETSAKDQNRYETTTEQKEVGTADVAPPLKKFKSFTPNYTFPKPSGGVNLLSMWTSRVNAARSKRHCEFAGRLETIGNVAELYQHSSEDTDRKDELSSRGNTPTTSVRS